MKALWESTAIYRDYLEVMVTLLDLEIIIIEKLSRDDEHIRNLKILRRRYQYYISKINKGEVTLEQVEAIDKELQNMDKQYFGEF